MATKALVALLVVCGLALAPARSSTGAGEVAPNVVVIVADDLDALISPFWDGLPETAARVRDVGFSFDQAFATTPACCPARSSILTGKYAHNTGVFSNLGLTGGLSAFQANGNETTTVAVQLDAGGYRTGLFGKYLNEYELQPTHIPPGWDDWFAFADGGFYDGYGYQVNDNGALVQYGSAEADYTTDVLAGEVVSFIDDAEANDAEPFFAYVNPTTPHIPLAPAPRHADHPWVDDVRPATPNYYEADVTDKPWWLQAALPLRAVWAPYMDTDHQDRMGSLLALDELVAGTLDRLEANGELDNTYIVFVSDNGYNLGAHGFNSKLLPYEESVRVPLVVAGPDIPVGSSNELVGLLDLAPTILDWAGMSIPPDIDGKPLQPLWDGSVSGWRSEILFEYKPSVADDTPPEWVWFLAILFDVPSYVSIRTDRYLFTRWWTDELPGFHEYELYDMQADPQQLDNLIADQAGIIEHFATLYTLVPRLNQLVACSGASCT